MNESMTPEVESVTPVEAGDKELKRLEGLITAESDKGDLAMKKALIITVLGGALSGFSLVDSRVVAAMVAIECVTAAYHYWKKTNAKESLEGTQSEGGLNG